MMPWAMGTTIDVHTTGTTNTFTAIVIESDRLLAFSHQLFIQHVEHFKKRHFGRNILHLESFKMAFLFAVFLFPHFQCEIHMIMLHINLTISEFDNSAIN